MQSIVSGYFVECLVRGVGFQLGANRRPWVKPQTFLDLLNVLHKSPNGKEFSITVRMGVSTG